MTRPDSFTGWNRVVNRDAMQRCAECGEPIDPRAFYREVTGWERPREQGGANQITLRHETGRVRCAYHVELERIGNQQQLWEGLT
jgi:recombinational DNA repair protein (RecF pathway)